MHKQLHFIMQCRKFALNILEEFHIMMGQILETCKLTWKSQWKKNWGNWALIQSESHWKLDNTLDSTAFDKRFMNTNTGFGNWLLHPSRIKLHCTRHVFGPGRASLISCLLTRIRREKTSIELSHIHFWLTLGSCFVHARLNLEISLALNENERHLKKMYSAEISQDRAPFVDLFDVWNSTLVYYQDVADMHSFVNA